MNISQLLIKLKTLVYSKSETDSLLGGKASSSHTHTKSQITDFPTIPSKTSQLTNDSGFITGVSWDNVSGKPSTFTPSSHTHTKSQITDFPSLATVATSGSYSDLSNRSLLTVNGATSLGWSGIGGVANGSTLQLCTTDNTSPSICFHRAGYSHVVLAEAGGVLGIQAQGSDWLELATKSWVTSLGYITSSGSCNYANSAGNSDTLDGYHEYSFLRNRGETSTSGEGTLWAQIGIKEYHEALPDGLSGLYSWGETVSFPGTNCRFEIYCSHQSSAGNGLYYRSGWANDKKDWRLFIDSANIGSQSVNYANSSGNADTVDGSHAWQMQTLAAGGGVHGSNDWLMQCQHNVDGDGYFKLYCGDKSVGTKVDRASSAGYADSAGSATNATYTNWLRTSSHTDHLLHTEWDGSYFWTYVTAGDGGYRAVRVERSNSSGYADSCTETAYMGQSDTITYGVNRLQYFNSPTSTTSGAANVANPFNDWYYHLLMSHGNNNGYYGDLAMCFHSDTLAFRRIVSGSDQGWCYLVKHGRTIVSGYEVYVG